MPRVTSRSSAANHATALKPFRLNEIGRAEGSPPGKPTAKDAAPEPMKILIQIKVPTVRLCANTHMLWFSKSPVALPARAKPARRAALRRFGERNAQGACDLMRCPDARQSRISGQISVWAQTGPVLVWHDAHPVRHGIRPERSSLLKALPPVVPLEEVMA